jgi:predicted transcriptional regulator
MVSQKLKEMKQRSGLTVEEISEKTNGELPISTINNILSGRTQDARFSTIVTLYMPLVVILPSWILS